MSRESEDWNNFAGMKRKSSTRDSRPHLHQTLVSATWSWRNSFPADPNAWSLYSNKEILPNAKQALRKRGLHRHLYCTYHTKATLKLPPTKTPQQNTTCFISRFPPVAKVVTLNTVLRDGPRWPRWRKLSSSSRRSPVMGIEV